MQQTDTPKAEWWATSAEDTIAQLQTDVTRGLSQSEAQRRLAHYGENSLPEEEKENLLLSVIGAFKDPLALVLTSAAVLSAIIGVIQGDSTELQQAGWIMGIVVFMTLVGFYTEFFADKEMEKLKALQVEKATVIRDGQQQTIMAKELIPGDVIVLGQGDKVPADARVVTAFNAMANEQVFTGEPYDIEKNASIVLPPGIPLKERSNMVLGGSFMTAGTTTAVVTATGLKSELGKIWEALTAAEEVDTPLQQQLEQLGKILLIATLVVCVLVVGIYIFFQQYPILDALIVAVALAIAFIPEALGAIILIALALGAREMVQKQAIIRDKYAAEGLGSVSVICTDKTGTITYGNMTVTHLWGTTDGEIKLEGKKWNNPTGDVARMLEIIRRANNLKDATDEALGRLLDASNLPITPDIRAQRIGEVPFNSFRKRMTTLDEVGDGQIRLHIKGAPFIILPLCTHLFRNDSLEPITDLDREAISKQLLRFEREGYRVLALAQRDWVGPKSTVSEQDEANLTFIGLVAISDPARPEVRGTIDRLRRAGIMVKMVTGDSPETAMSIGRDVGLIPQNADPSLVVDSTEIEQMVKPLLAQVTDGKKQRVIELLTEDQLKRIAKGVLFSRITPEDKVVIVGALQRAGYLVSMVGDGVNDSAAIKQSNVGLAMASGTDIAKAYSKAVLTGTYDAIASAVQVGRTILYRARLYIHALLSTNGAEVGIFIVAALAGWPTPLTAIQLLVINLLGDSWLSIALATEKEEHDVMSKPPRPADEPVITRYMWFSIGLQSVVATIVMTLGFLAARAETRAMGLADNSGQALAIQQTAIFIVFMVQKVLRSAFTARSLKYNLWEIGPFTNKWSLMAALVTIVIAFLAIFVLPVGMTPVPTALLTTLFSVGLIPPVIEELVKFALKFVRQPAVMEAPTAELA